MGRLRLAIPAQTQRRKPCGQHDTVECDSPAAGNHAKLDDQAFSLRAAKMFTLENERP